MSSNSSSTNKAFAKGVELVADTAIKGLQTGLPASVTSLTVGKVTYPVADLVKHAQDLVKPWKDARAAHAVIRQVMQARKVDYQKLASFLADLKIGVAVVVGRESEDLRLFGFTPQQRRKSLTSEQKALRAAKAKLTRELRHTQGSRQKAELKAETPSIQISPDGAVQIDPPKGAEPGAAAKVA